MSGRIAKKPYICVILGGGLRTRAKKNSTRPLVFTSASGCRASENFDISSENYIFSLICQYNNFVMHCKCLFQDI